jgi:hypothetical protein
MGKFDMSVYLGQKFGRWVILEEKEIIKYGKYSYVRKVLCRCECGVEKIIEFNSLKRGKTKSCGCYNKEISTKTATKHGLCMLSPGIRHPDYCIWLKIKSRCYNVNDKKNYKFYGGIGIIMSESWKNSFSSFIEDIGWRPLPRENYSIERIDSTGNYCKENCMWILKNLQNKNKKSVKLYTYNDKKQTLPDWCKELNLNYNKIRHRIYDLNIDFEKAIIN